MTATPNIKRPLTKRPDTWDIEDMESCISRNDPAELLYVPIWVSMDPPGRIWAEQVCVRLSSHSDSVVRGNAIEGFGHLARIYRYLNQRVVQPIIETGLEDVDSWVRSKSDDTADEVEWFLGWILRGREERRSMRCCPR